MSGGGKGGKSTTEVKIPDWLEAAAQESLGRGQAVANLGYTPYYGPDVAAMTPMQAAAGQGISSAAGAFGLPGGGMTGMEGMPAPQTFAGGVQGYSSGGLYDQSLAELQRRAPGQYNAITGMFINPQTGAAPLSFGSSVPAMPPMAAAPVTYPQPAPAVKPKPNMGDVGGFGNMSNKPSPSGSGTTSMATIGSYLPGGVNTNKPTSAANIAAAALTSKPNKPTSSNKPVGKPSSGGMGKGKA